MKPSEERCFVPMVKRAIPKLKAPVSVLLLFSLTSFGGHPQEHPELAIWRHGSGSPVIVVLHGGPAVPHGYLLPEWDALQDVGTVLFYDQRGCGDSEEAESYSWQSHVEDLRRILDAEGESDVILAGSSWGAILALLYGLENDPRVSGIVLSGFPGWPNRSSAFSRPGGFPEWPNRLLRPQPPDFEESIPPPEHMEIDTVGNKLAESGRLADSIVKTRLAPGPREAAEGTFRSLRSAPPFSALSTIKTPVLVLQGQFRGQVPEGSPELDLVIPWIRRVVIRGGAHDPWASDPEAFFREIRGFIDRVS